MPFVASFLVSSIVCSVWNYTDLIQESPGLLSIPGLFLFIPGDSVTIQALELVEGYWLAGVGRLFYSLILLIELTFGAYLGGAVVGVDLINLDPVGAQYDFPWWAVYLGKLRGKWWMLNYSLYNFDCCILTI